MSAEQKVAAAYIISILVMYLTHASWWAYVAGFVIPMAFMDDAEHGRL